MSQLEGSPPYLTLRKRFNLHVLGEQCCTQNLKLKVSLKFDNQKYALCSKGLKIEKCLKCAENRRKRKVLCRKMM